MRIIKRVVTSLLVICMVFSLYTPISVEAKDSKVLKKKIIYVNQTVMLDKLKNISEKQIKWSSNNKKVVRVTTTGKITAVRKGKATVKAVHKKTKKTLITYKIVVKSFKEKEIKSKITVVSDQSISPMKMLGKKYCVIDSKEELEKLKKELCIQYVKAGYGTKGKFKKTPFYKKLAGYKKSFFKNKTLCIAEHVLPYSGQSIEIGKFIKKQNKKGKVYGQLNLTYLKPQTDKAFTTVVAYQEYFIELNKSDAETLQNYKISVIKEK